MSSYKYRCHLCGFECMSDKLIDQHLCKGKKEELEKFKEWKKDNPEKGIRAYLLSLGKFKDITVGDEK